MCPGGGVMSARSRGGVFARSTRTTPERPARARELCGAASFWVYLRRDLAPDERRGHAGGVVVGAQLSDRSRGVGDGTVMHADVDDGNVGRRELAQPLADGARHVNRALRERSERGGVCSGWMACRSERNAVSRRSGATSCLRSSA